MYFYVYTVFIRCLKQGNHHTYGHVRVYIRLWPTLNICMYGAYTVISAGKSPYLRLCTGCIYGSGHFYVYTLLTQCC